VPTLPVLLLRKLAKTDAAAAALIAEIEGDLSSDERLAEVVEKLRNHPVADEAYAEAKRWAQEAIAALDVLPEGQTKRALAHFANAVVDRDN
jgi:heptaprenyl diphosphate synthase